MFSALQRSVRVNMIYMDLEHCKLAEMSLV